MEIWERFPKFVLGFIATFLIVFLIALASNAYLKPLSAGMNEANVFRQIFFLLTFFAIGLMADVRKLWQRNGRCRNCARPALSSSAFRAGLRSRPRTKKPSPDFIHYKTNDLPDLNGEVRVIAGSVLGASSPVRTSSPMFYADVRLSPGVFAT